MARPAERDEIRGSVVAVVVVAMMDLERHAIDATLSAALGERGEHLLPELLPASAA